MTDAAISLNRTTDRGVHGDLLLRLGTYRHTCDSYYIGIDDSLTAANTVENNLVRLLDQWIQQLQDLTPGTARFLPFDFSDQCTAWLRIDCADADLAVVQAGWSMLEGWRIMPSNFTAVGRPDDFEPIANARIACRLPDLIAAIRRNRDALVPNQDQDLR
jgi:hypothetical protein